MNETYFIHVIHYLQVSLDYRIKFSIVILELKSALVKSLELSIMGEQCMNFCTYISYFIFRYGEFISEKVKFKMQRFHLINFKS